MPLRNYQQELVDKINKSTGQRNCVQLATGGGKTHIFSHIANNYKGRVLILVDRTELLDQTEVNITRTKSLINSKTKEIHNTEVIVGMVESVNNRIKKGLFNIDSVDLIIVDEIQTLGFVKVIESFKGRLLGFTATPVIMKKESYYKCRYCEEITEESIECCGRDSSKYTKKLSLRQWYGELIQGADISYLIDNDYLTREHNFICDVQNLDKLKVDSSGEYSNKSVNEVFNNTTSVENLIENYQKHAIGKKTMIFNSNIQSNEDAYISFNELGYNVKSYDSKSKGSRKEVVDWFRETPDGILMSVGVFTTGFDVPDVEVIIMNKATKSLSLYHQIVGRGGRITNKIYKPFFKMVDLGGNVKTHGGWSEPVDWLALYNDETEKKATIRDTEDFIICVGCDAMITDYICEYCGQEEPPKKEKRSTIKIAKEVRQLPRPNAKHIVRYCEKNELDVNEGKVLTANYLLDMLIFSETPKHVVADEAHVRRRIRNAIQPVYFGLHGSSIEGNRFRTIDNFVDKCYNKIQKHYE